MLHILGKIYDFKIEVVPFIIYYTRIRELLLEASTQAGLEKAKFGLHSLRSGGVSEAAHNRIPQRLFKALGRWKSDIAKDGYIKENMR